MYEQYEIQCPSFKALEIGRTSLQPEPGDGDPQRSDSSVDAKQSCARYMTVVHHWCIPNHDYFETNGLRR